VSTRVFPCFARNDLTRPFVRTVEVKRARILDFEASDMFSDLVMCRLMSITTSWLSFASHLLQEEPLEQWRSS